MIEKKNSKAARYILWHCLRVFFEDLEQWRSEASCLGIVSTIPQEIYDDLLKGTRADVCVPLWASCAKTG
ncbi:MAG TPA: hypothetical protein P5281_02555, partial [Anaerovoracaceae bacterium]|nr:hypothetical protein [Anaerovoracaceae bacterium]